MVKEPTIAPEEQSQELERIRQKYGLSTRKPGFRLWAKITIAVLVVVGVGISLLAYTVSRTTQKMALGNPDGQAQTQGALGAVADLGKAILPTTEQLKGEEENRINILLVGIRGENETDGPLLADTIMLASIEPQSKRAALVSFPRDLYVNLPTLGYAKLNTAYSYGEEKRYAGTGQELMTKTIEQISGQKIHYFALIDFEGFKKAIDALGGVAIDVPIDFYDFMHNHKFTAGPEVMDGDRALAYVRARYCRPSSEGSDFARARRQQELIKAVKAQALDPETFLNIRKITGLLGVIGDHVKTDFQVWELKRLYGLMKDLDPNNINKKVIDNQSGLVYGTSAMMGGTKAYVIKPYDTTWRKVQAEITNIFDIDYLETEAAKIEVQNGSGTAGLANKMAKNLEAEGLEVSQVTNAVRRDRQRSIIYDFTGGQKPFSLIALRKAAGIELIHPILPETIIPPKTDPVNNSNADFVVIVGQD